MASSGGNAVIRGELSDPFPASSAVDEAYAPPTIFFLCNDPAALRSLLSPHYRCYVEIGNAAAAAESIATHAVPQHCVTFSLTARTAYHFFLAQHVVHFIRLCRPLTSMQQHAIETALHEAVANAIIHGSLEIHSAFDDTPSHAEFFECIRTRLDVPKFGERRVTVVGRMVQHRLVLAVADEGPGYAPMPAPDTTAWHGRGLGLIADCADEVQLLAGGRCIEMHFLLEEAMCRYANT